MNCLACSLWDALPEDIKCHIATNERIRVEDKAPQPNVTMTTEKESDNAGR